MSAALSSAEAALAHVEEDPNEAVELAREVLARHGDDPAAAATAERALGLAFRHLRDLRGSTQHFTRAIDIATASGLRQLAGLARHSMCGNLAEAGRFEEAIQLADQAVQDLDGHLAARTIAQKATIHMVRGDWPDALTGFSAALAGLEQPRDSLFIATVHANRGMVLLRKGELLNAERDMLQARDLFEELGNRRRAADVLKNLGMAATIRGDLPLALTRYDQADAILAEFGVVDSMGLMHRAHGLLGARLFEEAQRSADRALAAFEKEGVEARVAETLLYRADIRLAVGDPRGAEQDAASAAEHLAGQRRAAFRPLADYAEVRARAALDPGQAGLLRTARTAADRLGSAGWALEAADARFVAARVAATRGNLPAARVEIERAGWARRRGPAWLQISAWHAEAAVRAAAGNTAGTSSALRAGMRRLDRYQATLGASDLRARVAGLGADLARMGLERAIEMGLPAATFEWAERLRANSLELRPSRPPQDERIAHALVELRQSASQAVDARPGPRRQQELEEEVVALLRQAPGEAVMTARAPNLERLQDRLDGANLVEVVETDRGLHALVVRPDRARLVPLGHAAEASQLIDQVRFSASRLAASGGSAASRRAAADLFDRCVVELDQALVAPLIPNLLGRSVVVVPTGSLHLIPWGALPSLAGRPVTVTPSAALWMQRARRRRGHRVVVAAGPGLRHAAREVAAIAELHGGAVALRGKEATAAAMLGAMEGASLVHLAAHGRFRVDNPLFSSLALRDGPVYLCDIERLDRAPEVVVLSACDAALAGRYAGDELMGLAAAFLGLGTRTVVASTLPVSDQHTRDLMVRFHRRLASGEGPAAALAGARGDSDDSIEARVAAGSFVCLGRG